MIQKQITKYWISNQELLKVFGFTEKDLLMGIEVFKDLKNPLGYQIQGIDLYIEHNTESQNNGEEVNDLAKNKKIVKKAKKGKK